MKYTTVLFDFDGTVFDTVEGITRSVQYALRKHGIEAELPSLRCFAGPPLVDKFMEVYGVAEEEARQLVTDYRERYVPVGIHESAPFPGLKELLRHLRAAGLKTGVATSKPQTMAEQLLGEYGMLECFDTVVGSHPSLNNDAKWQIVFRAMEQTGSSPEHTVLIGDTKYDVIGALHCGIPCIGVRWGYAAERELEEAGALSIAESPEELEHLLLS